MFIISSEACQNFRKASKAAEGAPFLSAWSTVSASLASGWTASDPDMRLTRPAKPRTSLLAVEVGRLAPAPALLDVPSAAKGPRSPDEGPSLLAGTAVRASPARGDECEGRRSAMAVEVPTDDGGVRTTCLWKGLSSLSPDNVVTIGGAAGPAVGCGGRPFDKEWFDATDAGRPAPEDGVKTGAPCGRGEDDSEVRDEFRLWVIAAAPEPCGTRRGATVADGRGRGGGISLTGDNRGSTAVGGGAAGTDAAAAVVRSSLAGDGEVGDGEEAGSGTGSTVPAFTTGGK